MKLAIVTNNAPHHKYFINELCKDFNVTLIIQPTGKRAFNVFKGKNLFIYGFFWFLLKLSSLVYNRISKHSMNAKIRKNEKIFFGNIDSEFEKLTSGKLHKFETVNCNEAINLVRDKEVDVICFLGGDIAGKDFINAAKICSLNYHSGLSPFYNGNKTIFHAVKDFRPNFAGGTLMYITERIDGGGILAHYLPAIIENDSAASLFMKGIKGAVILYKNFLKYINDNNLPQGVLQLRSFKYVRNVDWTIADDLKLKKFENNGLMKIYSREEKIFYYYDLNNSDISQIYARSLDFILNK